MPVTTLNLPYPNSSDPIADYPAQASSMAWTLDTLLSRLAPLTAPVIVGSKPAGVIVPQFLTWIQSVTFDADAYARVSPPQTHDLSGLIFAAITGVGENPVLASISTQSFSWNASTKSFAIRGEGAANKTRTVAIFAIYARNTAA